jgi:hypothetical protein
MYQWTGDRRYVDLAWKKLSGFISMPVAQTGGNHVRVHGPFGTGVIAVHPGVKVIRSEKHLLAVADLQFLHL